MNILNRMDLQIRYLMHSPLAFNSILFLYTSFSLKLMPSFHQKEQMLHIYVYMYIKCSRLTNSPSLSPDQTRLSTADPA